METLFTTDLTINGTTESYEITFYNDQYHFKSSNSNNNFSLRREADEWHTDDELENNSKNAAIEKLEAYLLSQH